MENSFKNGIILNYLTFNFISSKDSNETRTMPTKSDNIEIMMGSETDKIIKIFFWIAYAKISRRIRRVNERNWTYFW